MTSTTATTTATTSVAPINSSKVIGWMFEGLYIGRDGNNHVNSFSTDVKIFKDKQKAIDYSYSQAIDNNIDEYNEDLYEQEMAKKKPFYNKEGFYEFGRSKWEPTYIHSVKQVELDFSSDIIFSYEADSYSY